MKYIKTKFQEDQDFKDHFKTYFLQVQGIYCKILETVHTFANLLNTLEEMRRMCMEYIKKNTSLRNSMYKYFFKSFFLQVQGIYCKILENGTATQTNKYCQCVRLHTDKHVLYVRWAHSRIYESTYTIYTYIQVYVVQ